MEGISPQKEIVKRSIDSIVSEIRDVRNNLIKKFLQDEVLHTYFSQQFERTLSPVKSEFLKRDLKALMESPIDLVHYSSLIREFHDNVITERKLKESDLFERELEVIFRKYAI
jgi:hypothetical protein